MPSPMPAHAYTNADALAEAIAQRCKQATQHGETWQACCPSHDDTNPSLSITASGDRVLVHCHAGCQFEDIVAALELTNKDFRVRKPSPQRKRVLGPIKAVYNYTDATGTLLHQTVRYEPVGEEKQFRQRRPNPDPLADEAWIWNLTGITTVLYHLPTVLQAIQNTRMIYITEGEKDAETLTAQGYIATCNPMGADEHAKSTPSKKWLPSYTDTLRGAHVTILPDYDSVGYKHAAYIASQLYDVAASVRFVLSFHTDTPKSDVTDWFHAGGNREAFEAILTEAPLYDGGMLSAPVGWPSDPRERGTHGAPIAPPGRTIDQYRHELPHVVAQAEEALLHMPSAPLVFQRARRLVAIAPAEKTAKGMQRPYGTPIISMLTAPRLRAFLAQSAAWRTPNAKHELRADMPQSWVVETLLDQEDWTFPPLTGIVHSPTIRPDGSLLMTQGYDADTGLWLAWQGEQFPAVPDYPTLLDAQTALKALVEPFEDFPFAADHHGSATVAAVLTLIVRYAVQSVPLFAIRATTRGSGKTLLADCIAMIATGRPAPKMPQVKEEEEERKRLLALALDGDPMVVIDNVVGALGNPALDLAVTSQLFKDRLLGQNATKEAPLYTVFLATGNNMFFKGDMARRAVPIDLTPLIENPETRAGFVHPRLLDWIHQERPRLLSAALTLIRAYWVAGKPPQPLDPYGSFEAWSDLIRSALVWAGAPDPCLSREGLEAASDESFEAHAELLAAWYELYTNKSITLAEMVDAMQQGIQKPEDHFRHEGSTREDKQDEQEARETRKKWLRLQEALGAFDDRFDGQRLRVKAVGRALKRLCGRVIDHKRLVQKPGRSKYGAQWAIEDLAASSKRDARKPVADIPTRNTPARSAVAW